MPTIEERIAAARANGAKGRGLVIPEGKAIFRRDALKRGLAGEGVVFPPDDSAEVERRSAAMLEEMRPATEMGRFLVRRVARLTVRVERCAETELAAQAYRAAHAAEAFDEARLAEVDHAMGWIAAEPATHARKLRSMPEGCDRLIVALSDLRDDLNRGRWEKYDHGNRLSHLFGFRLMDVPASRPRALSDAVCGEFGYLLPGEGEGLSKEARIDWAIQALAALIDDEIRSLLARPEALDLEAIEVDRATAADRSAFDPSKEGILARRYEAAAERGVFRALRELRRVEAAGVPAGEPEADDEEGLGSFGAEGSGPPGVPSPIARGPSSAPHSGIPGVRRREIDPASESPTRQSRASRLDRHNPQITRISHISNPS